jgi:hypothetical protein
MMLNSYCLHRLLKPQLHFLITENTMRLLLQRPIGKGYLMRYSLYILRIYDRRKYIMWVKCTDVNEKAGDELCM